MRANACFVRGPGAAVNPEPRRVVRRNARGFTMIELMVTIAIVAILAGLAVPSFRELIASNRLKSHASALHSSLVLARSEAIKRNSRVVVCKSSDAANCTTTGNWQQGWIIFADANDNAAFDTGEVLLHKVGLLSGDFVLEGSGNLANYVSYSSTGAAKLKASDTFQTGTFSLCQRGMSGASARQVDLFATGRLSIGQVPAASCTGS